MRFPDVKGKHQKEDVEEAASFITLSSATLSFTARIHTCNVERQDVPEKSSLFFILVD